MSDAPAAAAPKKGGKMKKILMMVVVPLVLLGAGVGGGVYAAGAGILGHKPTGPAEDPNKPKLVLKGKGKKAAAGGEGGAAANTGITQTSHEAGDTGGEAYETTYYQMDKDFTANLRDSPHFVQVGLALATNYDERVIEAVKNNEIPVRSAILMTLSDADENSVFTEEGKRALADRLKRSVNDVLIQKEGFGGIGNVYFTTFVVQ